MEKIGVFGGAFNPPHNFHFSISQEILNNDKDFSKIIFVPVGDKYKKDGLISAEHRFNMLKSVCDNNEKFEVSRIEIDETNQLKAFETLDKLSNIYSTAKLYFIIGTDSLKTLDTWANLDYLLSNYSFLVYRRGDDNFYEILERLPKIQKYKSNIIFADNKIYSNLSSSYIRAEVKNGNKLNYSLPKEVIDYIGNNNLY